MSTILIFWCAKCGTVSDSTEETTKCNKCDGLVLKIGWVEDAKSV
jgi:Zn finger protein HypA/HybF involved in hydrogenase expression